MNVGINPFQNIILIIHTINIFIHLVLREVDLQYDQDPVVRYG